MRIFILNPFLFTGRLAKLSRKRQPLSEAYIAAILRDEHEIRLLDANVSHTPLEEVIADIKQFNPDILVMTSTPADRWEVPSHAHIKLLINNTLRTLRETKIPITILTGSHGSVRPDWILQRCNVNFIVRKEPELTTTELIRAIAKGEDTSQIKGISYMKDGVVVNNPDAARITNLDELPFPAYDLLPMEKYSYTTNDIPTPFSIMITSRGCPHNCTYCLKVMMEKAYLTRSPQNVIDEMKYLRDKFGVRGIYFQDWEFVIIRARVEQICDLMIKENVGIKWGCNARVSDIDDEIAAKMKAAGCVRINVGFESGSQTVLDRAKKRVKMEQTQKAIDVLKRHGINIGLYAILNLPGETRETIKETEYFLAKNNVMTHSAPNLPIPYFGTEMYEMLKKQEGKEFDWENLEKFAGRVDVGQSPWLARLYRWHYKSKFTLGKFYMFNPVLYKRAFRLFRYFWS